jgi:hypothetical protein
VCDLLTDAHMAYVKFIGDTAVGKLADGRLCNCMRLQGHTSQRSEGWNKALLRLVFSSTANRVFNTATLSLRVNGHIVAAYNCTCRLTTFF